MIDPDHNRLSIRRQCELVSISRASFHRPSAGESSENQELMRKIGLSPIYQAPKTSEPHPRYRIYPYLLRHLAIERPDQVWCADVTYIPMRRGFLIYPWTGATAGWTTSLSLSGGYGAASNTSASSSMP